jgi:DNA-directed RNA polymerase specialized sigma24 family protein
MDDRNLLGYLDGNHDRAAEMLDDILGRLVRFFRWKRCSDPEELAQETVTRGLSRLADGAIVPAPVPYFYGIAHNVFLESTKKHVREVSLDGEEFRTSVLPIDYSSPENAILLEQYLAHIPSEDATLLVRYHTEDRAELADELGIDMRALRTRASRAKTKLETWVRKNTRFSP